MAIKLKYIQGRTFQILEDLHYTDSQGRNIIVPKGFETDLISVPKWLWSLFTPFDEGLKGDIIHDFLWVNRVNEITLFEGNIFKARKYADDLRLDIRKELAPKNKLKNYITHYFLRWFGGFFYSRQIKIPN
jgi:hypothetical protein